ncbi:hypothetical protein Q1695_005082 [Nippostrongylus brasiliensis]|nr:hypothetical protein Q1695_005082 [Nippostrongylus brasiliensis]
MLILLLLPVVQHILASCPQGTIYHPEFERCYKFSSDKKYFYAAEDDCMSIGGHLVSIGNAFENTMLIETAVSNNIPLPFFIGLNNVAGGDWVWTDNSNVTFLNWAAGQPDKKQNCVVSGVPNGIWSSRSCSMTLSYVCAIYNDGSTPECPPPPTCPAPPAVPGHCESEWTYFSESDSCYKTFLGANFNDAENMCRSFGSHLASIHSNLENKFIATFTSTGTSYMDATGFAWIGLHQANYPVDDTWSWTDGTVVNYLNWAPQQPDNTDGIEQCVQIYSDHMGRNPTTDKQYQQWNDYVCGQNIRAFVCKKPALH